MEFRDGEDERVSASTEGAAHLVPEQGAEGRWRAHCATALELFSPRGTDDFTMATGNALLCWAFGAIVY